MCPASEEIHLTDNLKSFIRGCKFQQITRADIANHLNQFGIKPTETFSFLKECELAIINRSPLTYDKTLLCRILNIEQTSMEYTPPDYKFVEDGFQIYDPTKIDATLDPAIEKLCKTKSYAKLERLMNPRHPLNVWIYGDTGLGKSSAVLAIAKAQRRPVVMVNMSFFTDVDDLIGGLRLINGETVMRKGPVAIALECGFVLLLDECDACNPQLLIDLHSVLDGKGILMKKANRMIFAKEGFCVIATANTKGRGDMNGDFVVSQIIGKPFLDRFDTAIEFIPPSRSEIEAIIRFEFKELAPDLTKGIGAWYEQIQAARVNGVLTDGISIRKVKSVAKLMLNYSAKLVNSEEAKDAVFDALNLKDFDVASALTSLWDSMLVTEFKQ